MTVKLIHGDSLKILPLLPANSCVGVLTDSPYGIGKAGKGRNTFDPTFIRERATYEDMGSNKGYRPPSMVAGGYDMSRKGKLEFQEYVRQWATELLRVVKPGGFLVNFGFAQTFYRMCCGIEDAGWDIKNILMWVFSRNISTSHWVWKNIDQQLGVSPGERPQTPQASLFDGYGDNIAQAYEPIVLAMKPTDGGAVNNALKWGIYGLNVEAVRIGNQILTDSSGRVHEGRFPKNIMFDEGAAEILEQQRPGVSRYFYCPKTSKKERHFGCEDTGNTHPTVKPIAVLDHLCKLIRPPRGGVILDLFLGSGSTAIACVLNDLKCLGIEQEEEYIDIAARRIAAWQAEFERSGSDTLDTIISRP